MNELITDLKSIALETLNNLKLSKASNTIRAYKSDFKDFVGFCVKNGFKSLPAEPKIVSLYLTYLSSSCKMSTFWRKPGYVGFRRHNHRHSIKIPEGKCAWTLLLVGPKREAKLHSKYSKNL